MGYKHHEKVVGFPIERLEFVMNERIRTDNLVIGSGLTHLMAVSYSDDRYRTLCGVEDVCGHWPFAGLTDHNDKDFCGNCRRIIKRIRKRENRESK